MSIQAASARAARGESEQHEERLVFAASGAAAEDAAAAAAAAAEGNDDDADGDDGGDDDGADAPAAGAERLLDADGGDGAAAAAAAPPRWQSRWATVGSVVNTMMGTTIVALPFGLAESGVGAGLAIIALLGCVSCFTCLVVIESTPRVREFSVAVRRLLGRRVQLAAWAVSVAIILGAAIIYHVLMQETLFALVATLLGAAGAPAAAAGAWRREYAALIPLALLYPVSCLRDLSLLVRFNSFGFLFMAYVIVFIVFHGAAVLGAGAAAPVAFVASKAAGAGAFGADGRLQVVLGGTLNFASLGGMMMLSFFLHNCVQPIVKLASEEERGAVKAARRWTTGSRSRPVRTEPNRTEQGRASSAPAAPRSRPSPPAVRPPRPQPSTPATQTRRRGARTSRRATRSRACCTRASACSGTSALRMRTPQPNARVPLHRPRCPCRRWRRP